MDNKVKQIYVSEDKFNIGITTIKVDGIILMYLVDDMISFNQSAI